MENARTYLLCVSKMENSFYPSRNLKGTLFDGINSTSKITYMYPPKSVLRQNLFWVTSLLNKAKWSGMWLCSGQGMVVGDREEVIQDIQHIINRAGQISCM